MNHWNRDFTGVLNDMSMLFSGFLVDFMYNFGVNTGVLENGVFNSTLRKAADIPMLNWQESNKWDW